MAQPRSPIFDNVDPGLLALIQKAAAGYAPYKTNIISGYRPGDPRFHGRGKALDVELIDPTTGAKLPNYHDASAIKAYQDFANTVYRMADPEMQKRLRWGGYFSGGPDTYGSFDPMHFDVGGDTTGMLGGSWAGGFSPEMAKTWNISAGGGIGGGQMGPEMPKARMDYTPEQRRAAIASIESAGSGDYNALGVWTGDPSEGRDRAYGRYQIMGKNIGPWSREVLGREVTPQEFMADPKIQDAIFDRKFGEYVRKYGEGGAASMWFSGTPNMQADTKDALGTTVKSYASKYLEALGGNPLKMGESYPAQQSPAGGSGGASPVVASGGGTIKPEDKLETGIQDLAGSVGSMFGAGAGASGQMPIARPQSPMASMVEAPMAQTFNPASADANRQRLAMALSRLNSGKLWV